MTQTIGSICDFCKHWTGYKDGKPTCEAFPDEIPEEVHENDHIFPVKGDGGMLFEPSENFKDLLDLIQWRINDRKADLVGMRLEEEEKIEKGLFGSDLQKSIQPLEEWADEAIVKDVIKADVPLFIRALMAVQHWIFASLSPEKSEGIYTSMVNRMLQDKWSISDLVKVIQETEPSIDDVQARAIARSESALIVNKSREMSFAGNPPDIYGYSWGGPNDHRTTEICTNIKARIPKKGVDTIDELRQIVKEEAQKYYDAKGYKTTVREWLPHPNCRHYIRSIWRG